MAFSCDHSGALIHTSVILTGFSHSSAVTVARHDFVRQSPFLDEKTYIPLTRGTIINAQPKKRAAICAWKECGGIEANGIAIVMRLCFLPGWPITAFSCNTRKMM